jgi:hypothetical protein
VVRHVRDQRDGLDDHDSASTACRTCSNYFDSIRKVSAVRRVTDRPISGLQQRFAALGPIG